MIECLGAFITACLQYKREGNATEIKYIKIKSIMQDYLLIMDRWKQLQKMCQPISDERD